MSKLEELSAAVTDAEAAYDAARAAAAVSAAADAAVDAAYAAYKKELENDKT
jgi:hypothetical protein